MQHPARPRTCRVGGFCRRYRCELLSISRWEVRLERSCLLRAKRSEIRFFSSVLGRDGRNASLQSTDARSQCLRIRRRIQLCHPYQRGGSAGGLVFQYRPGRFGHASVSSVCAERRCVRRAVVLCRRIAAPRLGRTLAPTLPGSGALNGVGCRCHAEPLRCRRVARSCPPPRHVRGRLGGTRAFYRRDHRRGARHAAACGRSPLRSGERAQGRARSSVQTGAGRPGRLADPLQAGAPSVRRRSST
jgi:hypothetical protein